MTIRRTMFAAGAAAAMITGGLGAALSQAPEEVIDQRQALMKDNGAASRAIAAFVRDDEGAAADVADAAERLADNARRMPDLFPEGTASGEAPVQTAALPAIWERFDEFEAAAATLEQRAGAVAEAARNGERAAIGRAFAALGRDGCTACHRPFREAR